MVGSKQIWAFNYKEPIGREPSDYCRFLELAPQYELVPRWADPPRFAIATWTCGANRHRTVGVTPSDRFSPSAVFIRMMVHRHD